MFPITKVRYSVSQLMVAAAVCSIIVGVISVALRPSREVRIARIESEAFIGQAVAAVESLDGWRVVACKPENFDDVARGISGSGKIVGIVDVMLKSKLSGKSVRLTITKGEFGRCVDAVPLTPVTRIAFQPWYLPSQITGMSQSKTPSEFNVHPGCIDPSHEFVKRLGKDRYAVLRSYWQLNGMWGEVSGDIGKLSDDPKYRHNSTEVVSFLRYDLQFDCKSNTVERQSLENQEILQKVSMLLNSPEIEEYDSE